MKLPNDSPTTTKTPKSFRYENAEVGEYSPGGYVNTQTGGFQDVEGMRSNAKILHLSVPHEIERAYRSCIERANLMTRSEEVSNGPESAAVVVVSGIRDMANYCNGRVRFLRSLAEVEDFPIVAATADVFSPMSWQPSVFLTMERAYHRRIEDLRGMANDEGFIVARESIDDFWLLIRTLMPTCKAQLVLTDDGNLIAIWNDDNGNYVDVEFLGDGSLHYLIFKGPERSPERTCEEGGGDIQTVKRQVQEHKLDSLLGI